MARFGGCLDILTCRARRTFDAACSGNTTGGTGIAGCVTFLAVGIGICCAQFPLICTFFILVLAWDTWETVKGLKKIRGRQRGKDEEGNKIVNQATRQNSKDLKTKEIACGLTNLFVLRHFDNDQLYTAHIWWRSPFHSCGIDQQYSLRTLHQMIY